MRADRQLGEVEGDGSIVADDLPLRWHGRGTQRRHLGHDVVATAGKGSQEIVALLVFGLRSLHCRVAGRCLVFEVFERTLGLALLPPRRLHLGMQRLERDEQCLGAPGAYLLRQIDNALFNSESGLNDRLQRYESQSLAFGDGQQWR